MEDHRGLKKKEYSIETEYLMQGCNRSKILRPFYDYYLPEIDIQIINSDNRSNVDNLIERMISDLKEFHIITEDKKINGINTEDIIIKLTKILHNDNYMDQLRQSAKELHPIIYCDINHYMSLLKMYDEISYYDKMYKIKMEED